MRLVSLKIYKKKNGETIRNIGFNERGLSLICDLESEENRAYGSSIGKTALIRCIDVCLGAKSTSVLYKSNTLGVNESFKDYLFDNQVSLVLTCKDNEKTIVLERHLFDNKEFIDKEEFSDLNLYCQKLKEIFFPNAPLTVTFRQMIPLFVRIDIEEPVKYLDNFTKNQQYNLVYSYFLNLYSNSQEFSLRDEMKLKQKELNKLQLKYKIKTEKEFVSLIRSKGEIAKAKGRAVRETDYVGSYASSEMENAALIDDLDNLTEELNSKKCKLRYLEKAIQAETDKLFEIDEDLLKDLYNDARQVFSDLKKSFGEFCEFHNEMCKLRINRFINEKNSVSKEIAELEMQVRSAREKFCKDFVEYKVSVDNKENSLFETYFSCKKEYEESKLDLEHYIELKRSISDIKSELSKIKEKKETNKENIIEFSEIFKEKTGKLLGNSYSINYEPKSDKMMLTLKGPMGNPGTGDGKVLSYSLNATFFEFFVKKSLNMPLFTIQDRMENVEIVKLDRIIKDVRNSSIQYIVPILSDRIDRLGVEEKEIILKLSKNDKLFKF